MLFLPSLSEKEILGDSFALLMRIQNNMIEPPKKAIFLIKIILYADQESFETPLINYLVEKLPKRLWWGEGLNLVLMLNESVSWTIFMLLKMNPAPDWSKEWDGLLFRKQN